MSVASLSPLTHTAADVVRLLDLQALEPEGGFFRRTAEGGPGASGGRRAWSAILFLLTPPGFSALHRLAADEIWTFIGGDPIESLRLCDGAGRWVRMASAPDAEARVQDVVRGGTWQGTRLVPGGRWALVSCVVVPEFVGSDFVLGERLELSSQFPRWAPEIAALTRPQVPSSSR